MGINHLPTFADLQRRHASGMASIARFDERDHLITYLREHGAPVATAEDVYNAVLTLDDEELAAFKCCEGVAISHLSDGWWLLLCTGELFATSKDCREGADGC